MVDEDRGQLLLVAGVLLALVIVGAAVLLNGIVSPGTMGTRGLSGEVNSVDDEIDPLREDLEGLFGETTSQDHYNESLPYAESGQFTDNLTAFRSVMLNVLAEERGSLLAVRYNDTREVRGEVLVQPDSPAQFTNNSGATSWKPATGVQAIPRASFNITTPPGTTPGTVVTVTDATGTWELQVNANELRVEGPGISDRDICTAPYPGDEIHVEIRNAPSRNATASVVTGDARHRCGEFAFGGARAPPWEIGLQNGHRIDGTYALGLVGSVDPGTGGGTWPQTVPTTDPVVNPAFDVTYQSDGITYESTFGLYNRTRP